MSNAVNVFIDDKLNTGLQDVYSTHILNSISHYVPVMFSDKISTSMKNVLVITGGSAQQVEIIDRNIECHSETFHLICNCTTLDQAAEISKYVANWFNRLRSTQIVIVYIIGPMIGLSRVQIMSYDSRDQSRNGEITHLGATTNIPELVLDQCFRDIDILNGLKMIRRNERVSPIVTKTHFTYTDENHCRALIPPRPTKKFTTFKPVDPVDTDAEKNEKHLLKMIETTVARAIEGRNHQRTTTIDRIAHLESQLDNLTRIMRDMVDRLADRNDFELLDNKLNDLQTNFDFLGNKLNVITKKITSKEMTIRLQTSPVAPTTVPVVTEPLSEKDTSPSVESLDKQNVVPTEPKVDLSGMYREAIAEFNDRCSHLGLNLCVKTKSTIPDDDRIPAFIHTLKTTFTELFEMLDQPAISFMDKYSEYFPRKNKAYSTGSFETILKNNGFVTVSDILRFSNDTPNAWYTQHRVFFHDIVSCLSSKHIKFCDQ